MKTMKKAKKQQKYVKVKPQAPTWPASTLKIVLGIMAALAVWVLIEGYRVVTKL